MHKIIRARFLLLLALTALTAGCGSGGGGDNNTTPPATGSSDWGTMVWDQDNWS